MIFRPLFIGLKLTLVTALFASAIGCSQDTVDTDAGVDAGADAADAATDAADSGGDLIDDGGSDPGADPGSDPGPGDDGSQADGDGSAADDGETIVDGDDDQADGNQGDGDETDGGSDPGGDPGQAGWRSLLYPIDWTPDFTDSEGRFLHDVSYAGYHYSEDPIPDITEPVFDAVAAFGADNTGGSDATAAIQATIDAAEANGGGVVNLPLGTYRLDGLLTVNESNVVLRGDGPLVTQLYFTRDQDMSSQAGITFRGSVQSEPELALAEDATARAFSVTVDDASSLQVGDDVQVGWVITDEFIEEHEMTGTWVTFNGQRNPFCRVVTAIDLASTPNVVELDIPLRYPALLRDSASLRKVSGFISECGIESLGLSNAIAYDTAWSFNRAHVLTVDQAKDCWVRDVYSFDSPSGEDDYHLQSGGIFVSSSKRVTVTDCRMERAQHRGGGGNGYLFEVLKSNEILIKDSTADAGRHNFIQNWDFGTSGCVFLRCTSRNGRMLSGTWDPIGVLGFCEYHHSLAMANLVDTCQLEDGWIGYNRHSESSGAGHSATQNIYWNNAGGGTIKSMQFQWGYVIGVNDMNVRTSMTDLELIYYGIGTAPEDWVEASPDGSALVPESLFEDQLQRRLR